jgi:hypothetical protein
MTTLNRKIRQKAIDAVIILSVFMGTGVYSCTNNTHAKQNQMQAASSGYLLHNSNIKSIQP